MAEPVEKDLTWLWGRWFWALMTLAFVALSAWVGWRWRLHRGGEPGEFRVLTLEAPEELAVGGTERVRTLVHDLRTGRPVVGEKVVLVGFVDDQDERQLAAGVTDAGGQWVADVRMPEQRWSNLTFAAYLPRDGEASGRIARPWSKRAPTSSLTTDKPLYQPGQTVHARVLSLDPADKPHSGKEVVFTLLDPNGTKIFKETKRTSEFGIAHADFRLAAEIALGMYSLEVSGGAFAKQQLLVERYALPKGRVTLSFDKERFGVRDTVSGKVAAAWSFGKPMVGAAVKVHRSSASSEPVARGK
ncbi:MAG: hypothetical protein HYZ36_01085, partial [Pedosphaera parvula]|nr:hypothetical protein [Pedosphaera parvula]